ncbi:cyclin-domain-containing protein [Radiomyces spectabilis]|uniref:cyclin-domain-containing protein n=1 Tax=Radiomyces spectabilis TaxID=64574 RepID=UPI002220CC58|nr:cyclin-domain-containing protein [Radiomyces spectabilis]KAI8391285.1 cyclin-domain-containing protein [Radiomyces spectabilis]
MSHFDLANHPPKDTIRLLASLLAKVTAANDRLHTETNSTGSRARRLSHSSPNYTCFHARAVPSISIHAYLSRILKYCPCSNECFLALLVYLDRMSQSSRFRIDSYNIHRLIIIGVMVASKLFSDVFYTNTRYAKVGGLPVSELNTLEVEFLELNNYTLFVTVEELQYYGDQLLMHWMRENHTGEEQHGENDVVSSMRVDRAARHLSIDLGHEKATAAGSKDHHRKSDEIDGDRQLKRPSTQTILQDNPHLPTPPGLSPKQSFMVPSSSSAPKARSVSTAIANGWP